MRRKRKNHDILAFDENLINLTPLIDVVFVVLISFIIIAPLLETDHIDLASSNHKSDKNVSKTHLILKVKEDNSILLNNRLVSALELSALLKEQKRIYPRDIPQLYHDKKAFFGTYQTIKNLAEDAGFEQMDVVLAPD